MTLPMAAGRHPFDPLGLQGQENGITNEAKEFFERQSEEEYKLSSAIKRILETDDGKVLRGWLMTVLRRPTWMPSVALSHGMQEACAHGYAREGQNCLIEDLISRADIAHSCKTPAEYVEKLSIKKGANYDSII